MFGSLRLLSVTEVAPHLTVPREIASSAVKTAVCAARCSDTSGPSQPCFREAMRGGDKFETYYSILGVGRTASTEEICKAYRRVSLSVHPDKGGDPRAFRRLSRAHDVLRDPGLRELYDKYGAALAPSSGDLIGSGTVGRLVPLSVAAAGGAASQFLLVVGAVSSSFWGLGCVAAAGSSWWKARQRKGGGDSAAPAIAGGLVLGNAAGFVVGLGARGAARLLVGRRRP